MSYFFKIDKTIPFGEIDFFVHFDFVSVILWTPT